MNIKIDDKVKQDLLKLLDFVQKKDSAWANEYQEKIFTVLYLLLSEDFRQKIDQLRSKYSIPAEWRTKEKLTEEDWNNWDNWILDTDPPPPRTAYDEDIIILCKEIEIEPMEYGDFVIGYLYFGDVKIVRLMGFNIPTDDEYRYKVKLDAYYGDAYYGDEIYEIPSNKPKRGYIRFYKDTTKNQLIKYIDEHWEDIERLRKELPEYPHTKRYGRFKRDIQIYLLHLLGNNTPTILSEIIKPIKDLERELTDDEEAYFLDEPSVRQVIKDINYRVKQKLHSVSKT